MRIFFEKLIKDFDFIQSEGVRLMSFSCSVGGEMFRCKPVKKLGVGLKFVGGGRAILPGVKIQHGTTTLFQKQERLSRAGAEPYSECARGIPAWAAVVASNLGLDLQRLATMAGVRKDVFSENITFDDIHKIVSLGDIKDIDVARAIKEISRIRPELFGMMGIMLIKSATLGSALHRLVKYKPLIFGNQLKLNQLHDSVSLTFVPLRDGTLYMDLLIALEITAILAMSKLIVGDGFCPKLITLRKGKDATVDYHSLWGCPVFFGQETDSIVYRSEHLNSPSISGDEEFAKVLDKCLSQDERYLKQKDGYVSKRVENALRRNLSQGGSTYISDVADSLCTGVRTLQRELIMEGTSFQKILDAVRFEIARELLRLPSCSTYEITRQLGFTREGAFYRAFKRWTGFTPEQYRNAMHTH